MSRTRRRWPTKSPQSWRRRWAYRCNRRKKQQRRACWHWQHRHRRRNRHGWQRSSGVVHGCVYRHNGRNAGTVQRCGNSAGSQWGVGFMASVEAGVPAQLIGLLVALVTPGVMASMATGSSRTGGKLMNTSMPGLASPHQGLHRPARTYQPCHASSLSAKCQPWTCTGEGVYLLAFTPLASPSSTKTRLARHRPAALKTLQRCAWNLP